MGGDTLHTRLCQTDFINTALTGIPTAPKAAKGTATDQDASCSYAAGEVADKAAKATTLAGYGITDTYTADYLSNWFAQKAAKATTLVGYGIGDTYTALQVENRLLTKVNHRELPLNTCVRGPGWWLCGDGRGWRAAYPAGYRCHAGVSPISGPLRTT